jgi:hypothetical protein
MRIPYICDDISHLHSFAGHCPAAAATIFTFQIQNHQRNKRVLMFPLIKTEVIEHVLSCTILTHDACHFFLIHKIRLGNPSVTNQWWLLNCNLTTFL